MNIYSTKHRKIWTNHYGPIPNDFEGRTFDIHHKDGNHNNNDIANLQCVSIQEHFDIHWFQNDYRACALIGIRLKLTGKELSELGRLTTEQQLKDGKHPFSQNGTMKTRLENGTHHFLDSDFHRIHANERIKNGTHNFQNPIIRICPHCGIIGKGSAMLQWHFDRCRSKENH